MSESEREERIRQRAYERYQGRAGANGDDVEDWLEAEREEDSLSGSTKHPPVDEPSAPNPEDAGTPPGSTSEAATGGAPGRGSMSERQPEGIAPRAKSEGESKEDKINEAVEESFPASDAPAWRGGSAN
jgi:hypothetical protein